MRIAASWRATLDGRRLRAPLADEPVEVGRRRREPRSSAVRAQPGASSRRGRAGTRRACSPTGHARSPSTTGTPRPRSGASPRRVAEADGLIVRRSAARSRRSTSSRPMIVFASWISPRPTISHRLGERQVDDLGVLLLRAVRLALDRVEVGREVQVQHRVGHPRRRVEVASGGSSEPARSPTSSTSSRAAVDLGRLVRRRRASRPGSRARARRTAAGTGGRARPTGCPRRRTAAGRRRPRRASGRCRARTSSPSGDSNARDDDVPDVALVDEPVVEVAEARHRRQATVELGARAIGRRCRRRSRPGVALVRPRRVPRAARAPRRRARGTAGAGGRGGS